MGGKVRFTKNCWKLGCLPALYQIQWNPVDEWTMPKLKKKNVISLLKACELSLRKVQR